MKRLRCRLLILRPTVAWRMPDADCLREPVLDAEARTSCPLFEANTSCPSICEYGGGGESVLLVSRFSGTVSGPELLLVLKQMVDTEGEDNGGAP